jgi:hypothetical protein
MKNYIFKIVKCDKEGVNVSVEIYDPYGSFLNCLTTDIFEIQKMNKDKFSLFYNRIQIEWN